MKAYELLSKPGVWTKGCYARDMDGHIVAPTDSGAVRFCIVGAVVHVYPYQKRKALNIFPRVERAMKCKHMTSWNDTPERTLQEVVALLRKLDL